MALDILQYASFTGPAFPEPFVRFELEKELNRLKLLPKATGAEGRKLRESWEVYRRRLRELIARGGAVRVRHHVLEPLVAQLGYPHLDASPEIETREGSEPGGHVMVSPDGIRLRVWSTALDEDLDAPSHRGRAYRFSHTRMAQRVLLATGERVGLLTNGIELRILLSDPARPDSQISIPIDTHWKRSHDVPDTYRLLVALASPAGVQAVPELVDKARLQQTRVTSELRLQARQAIERFVQEVLDHPDNRERLTTFTDAEHLARKFWHEGLITIYRLLFILKLESSDDPARSFSFASTSLWRNSFSPSVALARYARAALDQGVETGHLLEEGLQALFRMFAQGLQCTELHIAPLGGALFGTDATPLLSELHWGEHAVAHLLDRLLWTPKRRGTESRERVHYGPLDVEDLGRVYEALLELEPGITTEPMCRLRRQKLEVVVPVAQGERYRPAKAMPDAFPEDIEAKDVDFEEEEEEETSARGKKTRVDWIEEILPGRFYLRVGLGRKAFIDSPRLLWAIGRGLEMKEAPEGPSDLQGLLLSGEHILALPYELVFPEVFFPDGELVLRHGFNAVLGNPPWERIEIDPIEYFGQLDFRVAEEEDSEKRKKLIANLVIIEEYRKRWQEICEQIQQDLRVSVILYSNQAVEVGGRVTLGRPDTYRLFVERFLQLTHNSGFVSWIVPSSYHSNEGATGVRRLYRVGSTIKFCYSFENRRKLFDIDSRQKYCLLLAKKTSIGTQKFNAAFYLHDPEWLFSDNRGEREITFNNEIIHLTGGNHEIYVEVRTQPDLELLATQFQTREKDWGDFLHELGIETAFRVELHRNPKFNKRLDKSQKASDLFVQAMAQNWAWLPIHAGKTIFQYTDLWDTLCTHYVLSIDACATRHWKRSVPYYRFGFRRAAASTNERTMISTILTPGFVCEQTLAVETSPGNRPNSNALLALALANSYSFDWQVRQRVTTGLSNYILTPIPIPNLEKIRQMLCHSALRLICNHVGYGSLWHEQLGEMWRERKPPLSWPILASEDERWAVRAATDAVIADAYGLTRSQYQHVLSTFSHRSYPKAPELCLMHYDELEAIGLEAFTRKYDPYWDMPLNENLPQPVIGLPSPKDIAEEEQLPILVAAQSAREVASGERPTKFRKSREHGSDISPTDCHVLLLCRVLDKHRGTTYEKTLGSVKAEKISHIIESHLGIDLGRKPVRDAAGPVDYPHLRRHVFHRAKHLFAFEAQQREGGIGHYFMPLNGLGKALQRSTEVFGEKVAEIDRIIELFLPMDSNQAEIVATLYAAWNDLLATGVEPTEEHIFSEFYVWDEQKQRFDRSRLEKALGWMREHGLVPTGAGKLTVPEG